MEKVKALFNHRTGKHFSSKIWMILIALALVLALPACSLPARPYDVYVATNGNDSNNCQSQSRACLTLQEAINKSNTGSTIHVGAGTFFSRVAIQVNKFVTIQGVSQSQTILTQRVANGAILVIADGVTATLKELSLQGGHKGLTVSRDSHLIGDKLAVIQASPESCIENKLGGRIDLTNSFLSRCGNGIHNEGVFNGNNIAMQEMLTGGIVNWGAMDLKKTSILGTLGRNIAVLNSGPAGRARFSFADGFISNNTGSGLVNGSIATITSSTISGNHDDGVENSGVMTLENVEIENNGAMGLSSGHGSDLTIFRSGIVNNGTSGVRVGDGQGGASFVFIQNSTFTGNDIGIESISTAIVLYFVTDVYNALGLMLNGGNAGIINSIVELNTRGNCAILNGAPLNANAASLICDDALTNTTLSLGAPSLATGTTLVPLLSGSIAIDHADSTCPSGDQRGYGRPQGSACDLGSYEFGSVMALTIATPDSGTPPPTPGLQILLPTVTSTPVQGVLEIVTPTQVMPPTFILKKNAFCRTGPDVSFPDVTAIPAGDTLDILNVSEDGFWYFIYWKNFNAKCWVATGMGDVNGDITGIQVLIVPALPLPASPTPLAPCNPLIKTCP